MKRINEVLTDPAKLLRRPAVSHPAPAERIDVANGTRGQPPLYLTREQIGELGYAQMTNHAGARVWVSPLFWMHGEPVYPPVHLPPGDDRREEEAKLNARYSAYRAEKAKARPRTRHDHA